MTTYWQSQHVLLAIQCKAWQHDPISETISVHFGLCLAIRANLILHLDHYLEKIS